MLLREQYQEHSERDYLSVPLATYHFEQVTIPLHWHREVELILPQEAGELELEGQLHSYGPQELLCVNQGVLHRTWAPIPLADLLVVDLDSLLSPLLRQDGGSFLTRLAEGSLVFPLGVGRDTPAYRELAASFRACVGLVREKPPGWELPVQLELLKLLETYHSHGLLVERGPRASEPHTQAVKASIAYMRRNLDQELSLERLADQAALSPSHYIRVFRRYTGQTPFAFLSDLRLREAAHCLEQGMTVSETALHVGLGNLSYFIRLFRQHYGQTPKQYQLGLTSRKK